MSSISERLVAAGLPPLPRRAWLEIDLDALQNNVAVFREIIGPNAALNAVVKADAYGHGMIPVARAFEAAGVDRLCVASLDEGIALRDAGIEADILLLFPIRAENVELAGFFNIHLTVFDPATLVAPVEHDIDIDDLVQAEIEIETGLSRGGVKGDRLPTVLHASTRSARGIGPVAVWTHLASPESESATRAQVREFDRAVELALSAGEFSAVTRHVAATGGVLTGRAPIYEGVRIGLGLYGLLPLDLPIPDHIRPFANRLVPAMQLKCQPLRVETFPAGTAVGYGGTWVAQRASVIATLPIGYGDGFVRAYSPGAVALVRGRRVPLVGTVAMDAVMADVTEIEGVTVDDEVVLLGRQETESITVDELSRLRNTIPWEVVTSMSFRLPRVYHAGSVLMATRTLNGEVRASGKA